MFKSVTSNINLVELEDQLISYWKEHQIFEKSITSRPEDKIWTFLDGPPFITGMPHYGTLLPSILKDLYPRFWTMKGYRVRRVWGWDCHGLPAENKVESKLGIKRKKDIEEVVGVKKFIDECKLYVNEVSSEWQWYIDHIARWVDFEHAYKTMDKDYMETVMWVFKNMYDGGHIYKGLRVSLYCPHCSTPISNFEVAMDADNYKDLTETANTYKYQLKDENAYLLAWSTTPWTKLVTPALAVNPKITYVQVLQNDQHYILAKSRLEMLKGEYQIEKEFLGATLVGRSFIPHYDFYPIEEGKTSFKVIAGDFVSETDGTGIVTLAVYGEEDLKVMQQANITLPQHLDSEGILESIVPKFAGQYYLDANAAINQDLADRGLIYSEEQITHSIPTCWRCHTRLYYAPQNAWYVNVQNLKPLMEQTNEEVNWYPEHFKHGRFLKSMQSAPDWCISRSRYWGSPVPVWECSCSWRFVPGSIEELSAKSGQKVSDLHKPEIDDVTVKCDKCGQTVHRVPEVLDSWIEAASASFAERHFPFDPSVKLEDFFPPDFIVEYTGQIRAWFYVLHVLGSALYKSKSFKNVAVTGVILGTDGRKMSKNFGNYPDPKQVLQKYGGDALRLYLAGNAVTKGEDMIISEEDYKLQIRSTLLTLWNSFNFFITYANIDSFDPKQPFVESENILDQWCLAKVQQLIIDVTDSLEKYDSVTAIERLKKFIEDFSTWFIRRSRDRVGPSATNTQDKIDFYQTGYTAFKQLCLVSAPIIPFMSEQINQILTSQESVHLSDWPVVSKLTSSQIQLIEDMKTVRKVVEMGLAKRKESAIKVRQPLQKITITGPSLDTKLYGLIRDELNIKDIIWDKSETNIEVQLDTQLNEELISEGQMRELARQVQELRKERQARLDQQIILTLPMALPDQMLTQLRQITLASSVQIGEKLDIQLV